MTRALLPAYALCRREVVRFLRQRSRVSGALAQPIVFWLLLGGGLNASFRPAGAEGTSYVEYFYPGMLTLVLLFTAIFATISTVEDRQHGFLQGVLVAPVPRWAVAFGQMLGGTALAVLQGTLCLPLAPLLGIQLSVLSVVATVAAMTIISIGLTSLGLVIAWRMNSTQGFHAVMNVILLPIWFLSGAFFPAKNAPTLISWLMAIDPLTYGMAILRRALYLTNPSAAGHLPAFTPAFLVTIVFAVVAFFLAARAASRSRLR